MYRMITNNRLCRDNCKDKVEVEFLEDGSFMDVLTTTRNRIQEGWNLETHPMTGSLKPNQTPYKSILISDHKRDQEEFFRQEIIMENAIDTCRKFQAIRKTPDWAEYLREDYRLVDFDLIKGALQKIFQY